MKGHRAWRSWLGTAMLVSAASACSSSHGSLATSTSLGSATTSTSSPASSTTSTPTTVAPTSSTSTTTACIDLSQWSDSRLAAETVVVPVEETDLSAVETDVAGGAGGVILFGAVAPVDLGTQISNLADSVPGRLGLLVMTDEEGGGVQRMAKLVGNLPWPNQMGANWSPSKITSHVYAVARKMSSYGVNMDLAPVVDVDGRNVAPGAEDPDGWRSFSGTTSIVTADGVAFMRGLQQGGVVPVLKHFPGLGGASGNTDNGPAHTLPWSQLEKVAIPPFAQAIADGAPAVMISNATVPGLSSLPASLSSAVIQTELEGTLHFDGLVITDSLSAGAISEAGYTVTAASVQAIEAGADMVIYSSTSTAQSTEQQFQDIVAAEDSAVASGALARSRLVSAAAAALATRHLNICH